MERMQLYMPGKHRDYLNYLASTSRPIRQLAKETRELREPYRVLTHISPHRQLLNEIKCF